MIKIAVSASRKYNVIMDRGALGRAGELFADAGISGGRKKLCIVCFFGKVFRPCFLILYLYKRTH